MWTWIEYDVWGNEEDGWEVNQGFYTSLQMENPTKEKFVEHFNVNIDDVDFDESNENVIYVEVNGKPVGEFRNNEDII